MITNMFRFFVIQLILLNSLTCWSQNSISDSLNLKKFQDSSLLQYYRQLKANVPIYSGAEYTGHGQSINGHAFFATDIPVEGAIEYDGILYRNIFLRYELVEDAIIIKDYTQNYYIQLNSAKISRFWMGPNEFIRPSYEVPDTKSVDNGFYQILYKGDTWVLAKRTKQLSYKTSEEKVTTQYKSFQTFYIKNGTEWIPISNNKDIILAYSDKKVEIRKFISENHLRFKKDPDNILIRIAAHYNELKK